MVWKIKCSSNIKSVLRNFSQVNKSNYEDDAALIRIVLWHYIHNRLISKIYCSFYCGKRGGVVVEHWTQNREVLGSITTGSTVLFL